MEGALAWDTGGKDGKFRRSTPAASSPPFLSSELRGKTKFTYYKI
jgi:hypothetical protein